MLDLHTHVWRHEPGTPPPTLAQLEAYCDQAAAAGVDTVAITEHGYRFTRVAELMARFWKRGDDPELAAATDAVLKAEGGADLDAYVTALDQAQDRGLPILIGLEVDYLPGTTEPMRELLSDYPLDLVLGSVHWLFDAYQVEPFASEWEQRSESTV